MGSPQRQKGSIPGPDLTMDAGVIHYLPSSTGRALARTEPAPGNDYTHNLYSRVGNHPKQLRKHFDPRPPN